MVEQKPQPQKGCAPALNSGAVARFVFAIVFLGLGLGVFHVAPLPFLVAFGLGQVAFLAPGISSGL